MVNKTDYGVVVVKKMKSYSKMKTFLTLFVLFFSSSISFNSYGGLFDKTICIDTDAQDRNGIIFLPNQTEPFTGKNLCKYENGQVKSKGEIKDGFYLEETSWYENGQMWSNSNYKDFKLHGKLNSWFENGQMKFEIDFKNGLMDGNFIRWNIDGQKEFEGKFKDGERVETVKE